MSEQTPKREAPISYRPDIGREAVRVLAEARGLTIGAFLNAAITVYAGGGRRQPSRIEQGQLAHLLARAARINDRLSGAGDATDPYHTLLLEECRDELTDIRACLMRALGREP